MFEEFGRAMRRSLLPFAAPLLPLPGGASCDIIDEGDRLRVSMDMPGIKKDEVLLNVAENALEVHAEHKSGSEKRRGNYLRRERSEAVYDRIVRLPEKVVPSGAKSRLSDGVLEITLPKSRPTQPQKKRAVRVR